MPLSHAVNQSVLAYIRHCPIEFGKWRLSQWLEPRTNNFVGTMRTADGFLMNVETEDFIQRSIYLTGRWDEDVGRVIRSTLKADDLFIDIGANVGYFSLLASRLCRQVICFEPNPTCLKKLTSNVTLNNQGNIEIRPIGLADERRKAEFNVRDSRNIGGGSLQHGDGETFSVQLDTLDDQLSNLSPKLIKIDIEGAEMLALKGASKMLSKNNSPDVICEISEYSLRQLGSSKDELFALMYGYGYKYQIISSIRTSNLSDTAPFFQYDVLFYKKH